MEFTAEAVKAIQQPCIEAESLKKVLTIVDSPDPRRKYLVQALTHEEIDVPPPFRNHHVRSLSELIAYAKRNPGGVVWHDVAGVILLLDDSDRRDRVWLELPFSDGWDLLRRLSKESHPMTQRDFIRTLRLYLGASQATITMFRKLDFQTQINASGDIQKARESLGKSIEAEVKGTADLPDELVFEVPIYDCVGERETQSVRIYLEYDAQTQRILAVPEPGLLNELEEAHQADVHSRLTGELGEKVPVYFGTP